MSDQRIISILSPFNSFDTDIPEYAIAQTDIITSGMSAEKIQRDSPPKELADIAFASLKELEGDNLGA